MRLLSLVLAGLLVLLQIPLWVGKGSWLRVWEVDRQVVAQREVNARLRLRNESLDAEVGDLKTGYEAIEERARAELGMIRQDEVFIQVLGGSAPPAPAGARAFAPGKGSLAQPPSAR
jgi:cell division protein FtsB